MTCAHCHAAPATAEMFTSEENDKRPENLKR